MLKLDFEREWESYEMDILKVQYEMMQRTRESLFRYCETMSPEDYVKEIEALGGSIRGLQLHVAECYRIWLGSRALGKSLPKEKQEIVSDVQKMREVFKKTDALMEEFLNDFDDHWDHIPQASWQSSSAEATKLWLFTHTTTHEFHHKGQMLKIGRHLGYVAPKMNLAKAR